VHACPLPSSQALRAAPNWLYAAACSVHFNCFDYMENVSSIWNLRMYNTLLTMYLHKMDCSSRNVENVFYHLILQTISLTYVNTCAFDFWVLGTYRISKVLWQKESLLQVPFWLLPVTKFVFQTEFIINLLSSCFICLIIWYSLLMKLFFLLLSHSKFATVTEYWEILYIWSLAYREQSEVYQTTKRSQLEFCPQRFGFSIIPRSLHLA
jgi:hypothetical protein